LRATSLQQQRSTPTKVDALSLTCPLAVSSKLLEIAPQVREFLLVLDGQDHLCPGYLVLRVLEVFFEARYGDFLRHEKATQLPRNWSALYQQRPAPETGDYFKAEWFHTYTREPPRETLNIYGGSDYAVTSHGGDYTVHVVIGVDPENRMYLLDLWRGQTSSDVWIEAWCDLVKKWRPSFWAEEHGIFQPGLLRTRTVDCI